MRVQLFLQQVKYYKKVCLMQVGVRSILRRRFQELIWSLRLEQANRGERRLVIASEDLKLLSIQVRTWPKTEPIVRQI